jgi:mannose-6-phosphate isomerase-like protein (cupin superfamily)
LIVNGSGTGTRRPGEPTARDGIASAVAPGDVLDSQALGLRATVLESDRNLLRADVRASRGGNGGPLHRHLRQEERFLVHEGALRVREGIRGARIVEAGEQVAIRAGRPHTFTVVSERAHFTAEFRPAWEIAEVFRDVFALLDDPRIVGRRGVLYLKNVAVLIDRYPDDFFYTALLPTGLQRALALPLARRARESSSSSALRVP